MSEEKKSDESDEVDTIIYDDVLDNTHDFPDDSDE